MEKNNQPLVSVVIPCYNHENFVQQCIQSVINQKYENIELIIIDDGSKDSSVEKIQEMDFVCKERFIRFEFRNRPNKGLSATLNEALEWCEGEFISPIASDDLMLESKVERQVELLQEHKEIVAIFGAVQLISSKNEIIGEIRQTDKIFEFNDLIYTDRFLPAPTQMIRLNQLLAVGGFVEGMIIEDWYIYLKILESGGKILYIDEIFCSYRTHDANTYSNPYKMALGRLQVLNEFNTHDYFKKAYIKACWDNALDTLKIDFKLSAKIFLYRIIYNFKLLLNKYLKFR